MTAFSRGQFHSDQAAFPARAVRVGAELCLAAVAGWLLANALWLIAFGAYGAALPAPQLEAAVDMRAPEMVIRTDLRGLFASRQGGAADEDAASLPETRLSLSLYGVRTEGGGAGSAILEAGASGQRSILTGGEIEPGVILQSVHEDHVIISRRGAREVLYLNERSRQRARAVPAPAASITLAGARFTLVESGGWRLEGGPGPLGAFGLREGDVVTHVDGADLNRDSAARIESGFAAGAAPPTLTVERQGERIELNSDLIEGRVP